LLPFLNFLWFLHDNLLWHLLVALIPQLVKKPVLNLYRLAFAGGWHLPGHHAPSGYGNEFHFWRIFILTLLRLVHCENYCKLALFELILVRLPDAGPHQVGTVENEILNSKLEIDRDRQKILLHLKHEVK